MRWYPPRAKLTPVMWFSGRSMRWSDQMLVSSLTRSVPKTGSRLNMALNPTIVALGPSGVGSSSRTCHSDVLPEKKQALPPPEMKPSTVSRMPADQYSSWPTER